MSNTHDYIGTTERAHAFARIGAARVGWLAGTPTRHYLYGMRDALHDWLASCTAAIHEAERAKLAARLGSDPRCNDRRCPCQQHDSNEEDAQEDPPGWSEEGHERPDYAKPQLDSLPLGDDPDDPPPCHVCGCPTTHESGLCSPTCADVAEGGATP